MRSFISRARRGRLALLATVFAAFTLAACSDEQRVTAPSAAPNAMTTGSGDLTSMAEGDSTRITFTIDQRVFVRSGVALINGTIACSRAIGDQFYMGVRVQQKQPGRVLRDGDANRLMTCSTTTPQIWGIYVPADVGQFEAGKAVISVRVFDAPYWVTRTVEVGNRRLLP